MGQYKLDWIFVRPPVSGKTGRKLNLVPFAPYYGRTLKALNHSIPDRISDHNPITVDLEITEATSGVK